ncbi:MAG: zinc transporter ZupT [Clostridium sp.]|nr:zinc transporter ZupT [Clostridium sp.]
MHISQEIIPIFLSMLAGFSTVLGAFIVFFSKTRNKRLITFALSFSAGVMITISFTDLFPTCNKVLDKMLGKINGGLMSILFLVIGVIMAFLIDNFISEDGNSNICAKNNESLYRVGFVSMIALMLHNFPEGMATYISGYQNTSLGITIALAIALHNIPEGIAIAMPIYYSTKSRLKAFGYTFISGISEPFGALLSYLFLKPFINDFILSIVFALVAGIMIYISFAELIPEAKSYNHNLIYIFSLVLGICLMPISHIFL